MDARRVTALLALALGLVAEPYFATAQDQWTWPEKPENLQVLPKDWPGKRLRPVMMGFTNALGVRCSHCHVGEEGAPLSTYDFASDDNPKKDIARAMLKMLGNINEELKVIDTGHETRVNMWCHTCHRGRPRPMTLAEELMETYTLEGGEAALAQYSKLREAFYGRGAYDFGENSLNDLGYRILAKGDAESAIQVFLLNAEQFPQSANVFDSLAEGYLTAGDKSNAAEFYRKSLEKNPGNANARHQLDKIESGDQEE